jgi:formate hydrogenlyase subunit 6/NADH:ubiquinone oxidoreductase subunit I
VIAEYVENIKRSAVTIFEGMAVTFSHFMRPPITTQYPDRTLKPMQDLLPERYRGFLWVDLDICIACLLCERHCPIDCIKIDEVKIDKILVESRLDGKPTPKIKDPIRFDINLYKCMYCGLCVEPCPTDLLHQGVRGDDGAGRSAPAAGGRRAASAGAGVVGRARRRRSEGGQGEGGQAAAAAGAPAAAAPAAHSGDPAGCRGTSRHGVDGRPLPPKKPLTLPADPRPRARGA